MKAKIIVIPIYNLYFFVSRIFSEAHDKTIVTLEEIKTKVLKVAIGTLKILEPSGQSGTPVRNNT